MKKILILLTLFSSPSFAYFKSGNWQDDMNDMKAYEQTTSKGQNSIGFRCDITKLKSII